MIDLSAKELEMLAPRFSWLNELSTPPDKLCSVAAPQSGALHFVDGRRARQAVDLPAPAYLLHPPETTVPAGVTSVQMERPRLEIAFFTRALVKIRTERNAFRAEGGAWMSTSAEVAPDATLEPGAVIGPGAKIDRDVHIMAGAYVGTSVSIGAGCRIHPGARIGAEGFGYGFDEDGLGHQIAHLGGVVLEDAVDVGPNSTICAGTIDPTIVERGAKIDGHVYIGHNARVGTMAQVTAGAVVGGSAKIGERALINPGAMIRTKITIGVGAEVGIGASVLKAVGDGETVVGDIASEARSRLRQDAAIGALLRAAESRREDG